MSFNQLIILCIGIFFGYGFFVFLDTCLEVCCFFGRKNREHRENKMKKSKKEEVEK